jgi:hypothetical protein
MVTVQAEVSLYQNEDLMCDEALIDESFETCPKKLSSINFKHQIMTWGKVPG